MTYTKKTDNDIIIGIHPVLEAIKAGKPIDKVIIQKGLKNDGILKIREQLKIFEIPLQVVPVEKLNRVSRKNHQGVIAFASPVGFHPLDETIIGLFEAGKSPLVLVLDRIMDVRNFGAIVRSAEFFGVDLIIIPNKDSARINSETVKTSSGAIFNVKISKVDNLKWAVNYLKNSGYRLLSITEKGDKNLQKMQADKPLALILGSEFDGVSDDLLRISDDLVKIDRVGKTESLNVSVACSIALYQFYLT